MKRILPIFLLAVCFACGSKKQESNSELQNEALAETTSSEETLAGPLPAALQNMPELQLPYTIGKNMGLNELESEAGWTVGGSKFFRTNTGVYGVITLEQEESPNIRFSLHGLKPDGSKTGAEHSINYVYGIASAEALMVTNCIFTADKDKVTCDCTDSEDGSEVKKYTETFAATASGFEKK
jgi:hypothetical protein